ncbi:MAG: hypothetical protein IV107_11015 [Paucibacter sp.]|nr:hypothetical protein [Roseateles sp.]
MAGAAATMAIVDMAAQTAVRENSAQHLLLISITPQKTANMRKKSLVKMYTLRVRKRLPGSQMRVTATLKKARLAKNEGLCLAALNFAPTMHKLS